MRPTSQQNEYVRRAWNDHLKEKDNYGIIIEKKSTTTHLIMRAKNLKLKVQKY